MASNNVSSIYISVIEDVVANVCEDFITYGVGDAVLNELQALWEMKMLHCGAISGNIDRTRAAPAPPGGGSPTVSGLSTQAAARRKKAASGLSTS